MPPDLRTPACKLGFAFLDRHGIVGHGLSEVQFLSRYGGMLGQGNEIPLMRFTIYRCPK